MAGQSKTSGSDNLVRVQWFSLKSELRRAAPWGILGLVLIVIVTAGLYAAGLAPPRHGPLLTLLVAVLLAAIFLAQYLLPRVRVDDERISRRILWWWDLWPWEAFEAGEVQRGAGKCNFRLSTEPFWCRELNLELLEDDDAEVLLSLILRVWTPPPVPDCPEELILKLTWQGRPTVVLTAEGVCLRPRGKRSSDVSREVAIGSSAAGEFIPWSDVQCVRIWRLQPDRDDFRELLIRWDGGEVKLRRRRNGEDTQNWTGPTAELISAWLLRQQAIPMLEDYALLGEPRTLAELDAREEREAPREKDLRHMRWIVYAMWLAVPATMMIGPAGAKLGMPPMVGLYALMAHLLYATASKRVEAARATRARQRSELERRLTRPAQGSPS